MQFHLDTFFEYVAMTAYLLVVFSVIGAPVKLLLHAFGVSVGRVVPAPLIGMVITVIASWYWATPFGGTRTLVWILLGGSAAASMVILGALRRRLLTPSLEARLDLGRWLLLALICFGGVVGTMVVIDGQLLSQPHL